MQIIPETVKIAERSHFDRYRTGAIIVSDRTDAMLSNGWSHTPQSQRYGLYSLHAELHALARGRHIDLRSEHASIWIVTLTRGGNLTSAKPCITCAIAMSAAGIEKCYYTMPDKRVEVTYLDDLLDMHDLKKYRSP